MSEQIFKSPGYYDREIDLSVRTSEVVGTPMTVIGASQKGPAFIPYTIGSYDDFAAKFGHVDSKYYGGYAVQTITQHKPAVTFVRVLGAGSNTTTAHFDTTRTTGIVNNAGFSLSSGSAVDGRKVGACQFLVAQHVVTASEAYGFPMFTDNNSYSLSGNKTSLVRAVIFPTVDARIMIMHASESFTDVLDDYTEIYDVSTSPMYRKFKLVISSSAGSSFANDDGYPGLRILSASLNPSDDCYVGKILNTDPEKFSTYKHYLYADFAVDNEIATITSGAAAPALGSVLIASGSSNVSATSGDILMPFNTAFGTFTTRFTTPKTTWFISQPFGVLEHNLFYVESLDDGEYANTKYKISISGLKASADPKYEYGTFALQVRSFDDTDTNIQVLEQFNNLTLDPQSDNYIAKVIGDKKVSLVFDAEEINDRKLKVSGKHPNKSKLIRVVMNTDIEKGRVPAKALPFGFRGYEILNTNSKGAVIDPIPASSARMAASASAHPSLMTGSIVPPLPHRFKITRGDVNSSATFTGYPGASEIVDARYYWGIKTERNTNVTNPNVSNEANRIVSAITKFAGLRLLDTVMTGSAADTFNNNKFTLARVALSAQTFAGVTASAAQHMREAAYIRNGSPDPTNYYISDGAFGNRATMATVLAQGTASDFNRFTDYNKFTAILAGGFDGINIFDKNAARYGDKATSTEVSGCAETSYTSPGASVNYSGTGTSNNAVFAYRTAIDVAMDLMNNITNVLAIPGQREPLVTDYAATKNKDYSLAFYIMDIPQYDGNDTRIFDGDAGVFIDVDKTASNFDSRTIDNNSVAAYFPNFIMDDRINNRRIAVPASVAGCAAFAYNDKLAYPWFVPAGFNRNALDIVKIPAVRINQNDRATLFNARINPIVKFPGEGYVFFSQRTLQQTKSVLEDINIKRLVLEVKRVVSNVGNRLLFEQITPALRSLFVNETTLLLTTIQSQQGLKQFKVICDVSNNTDIDVENNRMNARIEMLPVKGVEYISMDFIITPSGVTMA